MKIRRSALYFAIIFFFFPTFACAEVIFHDAIGLKGKPIMLEAETRGKLFRKGGELVEFIMNGKSIGKSLSGGDGVAFKEFTPLKTGIYKISAISGKDRDNGFLLSFEKGSEVAFVDTGTLHMPFSDEPMKKSREVILAISKRFPVVYINTGVFGIKATKEWLFKNGFTASPLLPWAEGFFGDINEMGLKIKLVIGGEAVIESARDYKPRAFSFEDVEGAEEVKDWEDIGKKLKLIK